MSRSAEKDRGRAVIWIVGFGFAATALSQANVQIFSASKTLKQAAASNRYFVSKVDFAKRGSVFSSDGKILAQNADTFELSINFSKVPNSPGFFADLASAAGITASELEGMSVGKRKSISWKTPLSLQAARQVQEVKTSWRADGVSLQRTLVRAYPLAEAASGILGRFVDEKPLTGLERSFDNLLCGTDGFQRGLVDRTGAFLPMRMSEESKVQVNGKDIVLTIDSTLQADAARAVRECVTTNKADSGVAIVYDPATGKILAMANWPSIDPSGIGDSKGGGDFNPNFMGTYEPGSTFKIMTLAKALDEHKLDLSAHINCTGVLQLNSAWRIRCDAHHGNRAHGSVDAQLAIAKSCNVSAATWAVRVGYKEMVGYLEALGLLSKTKLGLPGERAGLFNRNEYAKVLQIANVGFGQSMSCTPLALASAFGMLANDGVRMEPTIIESIGGVKQASLAGNQVVSKESAGEVLDIMESVIESDAGTGKGLRIPGYRLAGKTGTAQKIGGGSKGYVSSFVGFVPSKSPRAMILVMIDNPKGGKYYGASVAGPVFVTLAKSVIGRLQIAPTEPLKPAATKIK